MDRPRQENRDFKEIPVGVGIRRTLGSRNPDTLPLTTEIKIYRRRRYPNYWTQDRYDYFVPDSITNVESEPYRRQWIAAVHKWRYDLTTGQKKEYNDKASWRLGMSGYNLFMREAMKGLIEMYVDRGDPAAYDKIKTDLITDATWRDIDLSAIVPAGAKAVLLKTLVQSAGVGDKIRYRLKGNANEINACGCEALRANVDRTRLGITSIDANRVMQYNADNVAWTTLSIVVRGWWT